MIPQTVIKKARIFFEKHTRFFVLGHREPDGDCVASQLVLTRWLRSRNKSAEAISAGPFDRAEICSWASEFRGAVDRQQGCGSEGVVLVDCSHYDRVGLELSELSGLPLLVMDHHSSAGEPTPAGVPSGTRIPIHGSTADANRISLIVPSYPSTSLLLFDLLVALGSTIDKNTADLLLFGFCTDTGYFRHLNDAHSEQFFTVARLVRAGASPQRIYRMIYGNRSLEYVRLLGGMLSRTEPYREGRLLLTWQNRKDRNKRTGSLRGSDELFRLLLAVANVEVAVLVKEEDDGSCAVSLRSIGDLDVGRVALRFGGGGHRNAAGYTSARSIVQAKKEIIERLSDELGEETGLSRTE